MNIASNKPEFALDLVAPVLQPIQGSDRLDLRDVLSTLRRHLGKSLVWIAICIGASVAYLQSTPPEFVASTMIILEPSHPSIGMSTADNARSVESLDAAQADSRIQVVKSERILRFVFDSLGLASQVEYPPPPPGWRQRIIGLIWHRPQPTRAQVEAATFLDFMSRVGARRIGQSYVLEVSFRSFDPATATRRANSITSAYIWDQIASVRKGSEFLEVRVASIKAEEAAALNGVKQGEIPDVRFPDSEARVIGAAIEPTMKTYPQSAVILAFAGVFGLTTTLGGLVLLTSLDSVVRTRRHVVRYSGYSCLAVLPPLSSRERRHHLRDAANGADTASAFYEALRAVRTAVIRPSFASSHCSIGIVSWRKGDGKSTVASGLARIVSATSEDVVLVDADLANPSLTRVMAPDEPRGLTESLFEGDRFDEIAVVRTAPHLCFAPAIGVGRDLNPDAFVGRPPMARIIADLQSQATVILDLPAMGLSSDAQAVGNMLDGVIIVVEAGRTTLDDFQDCLNALRVASVTIVGIVLNCSRRNTFDRRAALVPVSRLERRRHKA